MKIVDELLASLNYEASLKDIRQGPFQTAVLTRYCGLASTPHDSGSHHNQNPVRDAGTLMNKDIRTLACLAKSEGHYEAAIGMAIINSLIEIDEKRCSKLNASELIIRNGEGKRIALIGHFPFVTQISSAAKKLWVIAKKPEAGDLPEAEASRLTPEANVVGITGTAFTNKTIERLLELCRPKSHVIIIGDTSPLSPILFDYGIDAISGTRVMDPKTTLQCISEGATYRQLRGIRKLTMMKNR